MQPVVTAGAGFLLAVLWFDLMFDMQVARYRHTDVPEPVVGSIAAYYRRVTTDARPMNRLVALAMLVTLAGIVVQLVRGDGAIVARCVSLVLALVPIALAGARTLPSAVRLGSRRDPFDAQAALARAIFAQHVICACSIAALLVVQLVWMG
ncbi:MAG TPA: hypothetical protein VGJ03_08385 [Acidimicrobiales bacterium]